MIVHRIALAIYSSTPAAAFSGKGGLCGKGRWHIEGRYPVVYASKAVSLAMAEALVHLQRSTNIAAHTLWSIDIPDALVARDPVLPPGWAARYSDTQAIGNQWLESASSVALLVPSAIVPTEQNCLINPLHHDFSLDWIVSGPAPFHFDTRLTRP